MKYSAKIYAQLLAELIEEKKEDIVDKFFNLLKKNGDLKKAQEVIHRTEKILLKKSGGKKIVVEVARASAMKAIKGIAQEKDIVIKKLRPELIAGARITIDDQQQLDYSLKRTLEHIFP